MNIPEYSALTADLRGALVSKAEDLYLLVGEPRADELVRGFTGVPGVTGLPSDWFADSEQLDQIDVTALAIWGHIEAMRAILEERALCADPRRGLLDAETIEQEHLDLIEAFLSGLPTVALGGWDWTGTARKGAIYDLLMLGKAWHRLVSAIDLGTSGGFDYDLISGPDLALIAGIEVRSLRNLIGPTKPIRTTEGYTNPKERRLSPRAFSSVNRFDALNWLLNRRNFKLAKLRPGRMAARLQALQRADTLPKAAVLAGLALGQTIERMAVALDVEPASIRAMADGSDTTELTHRLVHHIVDLDHARASDTAPA